MQVMDHEHFLKYIFVNYEQAGTYGTQSVSKHLPSN